MIVAAALVPSAPVLLPEYRSLADPGAPWRQASVAALTKALRAAESGPGATELVVVGSVSTGSVTSTHAYRSAPLSLRVARLIVSLAATEGAFDPAELPVEEVVIAEDATPLRGRDPRARRLEPAARARGERIGVECAGVERAGVE